MVSDILNLQTTDYGAGANPTGSPIGGGIGYKNIITPSQATYIVNSLSQLKSALSSAISGQIIYVNDSTSIDMTGEGTLVIPTGVILASGRGNGSSNGALLYSNSYQAPLFRAGGTKVRVTGLRIQGPFSETDSTVPNSRAIATTYSYTEVDNCEIWAWTHSGVYFMPGATNGYAHHNYIHHVQKSGYGYGVSHGFSTQSSPISSFIEANIFAYCRHSIQATGEDYGSYEARYNIVLENPPYYYASIERHGNNPQSTMCGYAGEWTIIHHNTFMATNDSGVLIRGKPYKGAKVYNNWFYHSSISSAICLRPFECGSCMTSAPNVEIYDNWYGTTPPPTTGCTSLSSCNSICPTTDFQVGSSINIQTSWIGGQSPFKLQVFKDNLSYGNPISITSSPSTVVVSTDSSWTAGNHSIYIRVTDSCSTPQSCNTNTCTINITSSSPPPTPILIANWKFDEGTGNTVSDLVGNYTGTLYNTTWVPGRINSALSFNGTNSYVDCGTNLNLTTPFTIIMWIKQNILLTWRTLIGKGESSTIALNNYYLSLTPESNVYIAIGDGTNVRRFKTTSTLDNNWHHLAFVFASSTDMKIYIDALLQTGEYSGTATTLTANNKKTIIGASTPTEEPFSGIIDEVKVFNYAMTNAQVQAEYEPITCPDTGITLTIS